MFIETRIIGQHLPLIVWVYLHSNFSGGLYKFFLFLQDLRSGHTRASKVIDFGTNRKRMCNFQLVRHNNLGPILHGFRDIAGFLCSWPHSYSTLLGWVTDRLWVGKPSLYVTSHLGQLSLPSLHGW